MITGSAAPANVVPFLEGRIDMIFMFFILPIVICACIFRIWALVDCLTKESDTGKTEIAWLLAIPLAHIVGAAIYYFVRRPQRHAELGR